MSILTFNGIAFQPLKQQNQIWLSSSELAKALGYAETDSVTKIYNRNKDEFTSGMTTTVKMTVVRKTGKVEMDNRIFSLRGCHLIAMFARTTVAKEFRKWVLNILDKEVGTPVQRHTISVEQQAQIRQAVARRCQSNRRHYQTIYSALHQKFNIPRYSELLASDFDTAMSFIRNYGFNNNGDNNGYEQLYIALTDSVTNIRAYLKLIKSLKGLPFMDENVAQKMYYDGQDTILRIAKIAQALDLRNMNDKPMFESDRLNYYGGAALIYR